jgi:hypothetical protein
MKTMELERMGLVELTLNEGKETNGGWILQALEAIAIAIYVINNWDDFAAGFSEGQAVYKATR